jgi:hypothetical protein
VNLIACGDAKEWSNQTHDVALICACVQFTHTSRPSTTEELQLYTKDEVFVEDGSLILQTRYRPDVVRSYGHTGKNFTSGWIDSALVGHGSTSPPSHRGFWQTFGRFEWRAKLPPGMTAPDVWPALWMMPEGTQTVPPHLCWPAGGEIDVMESWGGLYGSQVAASLHWTPNASVCGHTYDLSKGHVGVLPDVAHGAAPIDFSAAWHTFSVDWNATAITFAVDGKAIGTTGSHAHDRRVPTTPFYLIMNVAICGASWCTTGSFPHTTVRMEIDWVRVYAWAEDEALVEG